jgi:hypothetical protein
MYVQVYAYRYTEHTFLHVFKCGIPATFEELFLEERIILHELVIIINSNMSPFDQTNTVASTSDTNHSYGAEQVGTR